MERKRDTERSVNNNINIETITYTGIAFQTAVSLAEYDAEKGEDGKIMVTDEHLRAVVELSKDFKDYLNTLHQGDEGKRAERKFDRLGSYGH